VRKVYLASTYSRHLEMQEIRRFLSHFGIEVTSRWINGDHTLETDELLGSAIAHRFAEEDLQDLQDADTIISFTGTGNRGRGGRHVEFGYALAIGKRLLIVGSLENVFHCLPVVEWFETIEQFKSWMENDSRS